MPTVDWPPLAANFATGVVVAVLTAFITVRLALRRFYSEKWWERKSVAYTAIIESLHHLREHAETNLTFSMLGKDLPPEGEKRLSENVAAAMADLRKHRDIGSFVISEEALEVLAQLFSELEDSTKTRMWQEHLEIRLVALDKCLPEMRRIARKDLSLS